MLKSERPQHDPNRKAPPPRWFPTPTPPPQQRRTSQRLKGLTTGGLPTFIDFRDNFHSPEIAEDNWVSQVRERAKRRRRRRRVEAKAAGEGGEGADGELVFMGDDTWTSLYPTYFSRSYPFPSFNTR